MSDGKENTPNFFSYGISAELWSKKFIFGSPLPKVLSTLSPTFTNCYALSSKYRESRNFSFFVFNIDLANTHFAFLTLCLQI